LIEMSVFAASHVHSSWSYDGVWKLADLAAAFAQRGYRVMMTTEHDRGFSEARLADYREACARCSSSSLFVLPGIEYSDPDNRVHVLVWGPVPFLGEGLATDDMLDAVAHHGGVAVLAHPERRDVWEEFRPKWQQRLLGIEVWNRKYDGWAPSERAASLISRAGRIPFVGLDFHTERQFFPLAMRLGVEGPINEPAIIAALRAGRCAATAFGVPLTGDRFERRLPYLRVAERGRRRLSQMKRRTQGRVAR
jgi:hypothetical protein